MGTVGLTMSNATSSASSAPKKVVVALASILVVLALFAFVGSQNDNHAKDAVATKLHMSSTHAFKHGFDKDVAKPAKHDTSKSAAWIKSKTDNIDKVAGKVVKVGGKDIKIGL